VSLTDDEIKLYQNLVTQQAVLNNELGRINGEIERVYKRINEVVDRDEKATERTAREDAEKIAALKASIATIESKLSAVGSAIQATRNATSKAIADGNAELNIQRLSLSSTNEALAGLTKIINETKEKVEKREAQLNLLIGLSSFFGFGGIIVGAIGAYMKVTGK
jgi:chromosome segregation ATPase